MRASEKERERDISLLIFQDDEGGDQVYTDGFILMSMILFICIYTTMIYTVGNILLSIYIYVITYSSTSYNL
jgi:hypothetical protein